MEIEGLHTSGYHTVKASLEAVKRFRAWAAAQGYEVPTDLAAQAEIKGRCALDFETDPPTSNGMPPGVPVLLRAR